MHRRIWDAHTKAKIVLQGLQGKPVAKSAMRIRSAHLSTINGATSFSRMRQRPLTASHAIGKKPAWRVRMRG